MPPLGLLKTATAASGEALIDEALATVREHFGMAVAYLSRFEDDALVVRNVSAPGLSHLIKPGDRMALGDVYCSLILSGELPSLIPDTAQEPLCREFPITNEMPIGSHIGLPVRLMDGTPYGMFCCLSPEPDPTLNRRDLAVMSSYADYVTRQVQKEHDGLTEAERDKADIEAILRDERFDAAFQPIVRLWDHRIVGYEALIRFHSEFGHATEDVFRKAIHIGLGLELELRAAKRAIACAPDTENLDYVSVNASPELICDPRFEAALAGANPGKLVIEVTEYSDNSNIPALLTRLVELRSRGFRIAIDDVGAGYSDFQRITQISPDILKIDRSIVSDLDRDPMKRAAVAALRYFASETGPTVVAEGVEREEEAAALRALDVPLAQGWLFGRASIPDPASPTHAGAAEPDPSP